MTGTLLAACLLTRQVAVGLAAAILIDLVSRGRWHRALLMVTTAALLVSPWLIWMAAGSEGRTQAGLVLGGQESWFERVAGQLGFYVRRIPDQVAGPFVEVGTAFHGPGWAATAADLWAMAATGIIAFGWIRALGRPRRRLAGLVPMSTLALLLVWPYTEAGRFLVPLIPCILVGAVEGLSGLWRWGRLSRRRLIAAGLVLAATLPYSAYCLAAGKARAAEARSVTSTMPVPGSPVNRAGPDRC